MWSAGWKNLLTIRYLKVFSSTAPGQVEALHRNDDSLGRTVFGKLPARNCLLKTEGQAGTLDKCPHPLSGPRRLATAFLVLRLWGRVSDFMFRRITDRQPGLILGVCYKFHLREKRITLLNYRSSLVTGGKRDSTLALNKGLKLQS